MNPFPSDVKFQLITKLTCVNVTCILDGVRKKHKEPSRIFIVIFTPFLGTVHYFQL